MSRASHINNAAARRTDMDLDAMAVGDLDAAIDHLRKAVALASYRPNPHLNLSQALLLADQFTEGWREMQWMFPAPAGALAL